MIEIVYQTKRTLKELAVTDKFKLVDALWSDNLDEDEVHLLLGYIWETLVNYLP